jgi:hypothetical protein
MASLISYITELEDARRNDLHSCVSLGLAPAVRLIGKRSHDNTSTNEIQKILRTELAPDNDTTAVIRGSAQ